MREITGGRLAYGAIDSVSGDLLGTVVASVRNGGSVLIFGAASGLNFQASAADFIFRSEEKPRWINILDFCVFYFLNAFAIKNFLQGHHPPGLLGEPIPGQLREAG